MTIHSIKEASKLVGKSSQTIYRHTKSGKVSKTGNGYDTAELIRVYGALRNVSEVSDDNDNPTPTPDIEKNVSAEVEFLKRENEMLRKQLEKTEKRLDKEEERCDKMWQTIENRLPAPGSDTSLMGKLKTKFFD